MQGWGGSNAENAEDQHSVNVEKTRNTQVSEMIYRQNEVIEHLYQDLVTLEKRLVGVLLLEEPVPDSQLREIEDRPTLVPLADMISTNNIQLQSFHNRLASLLSRLEL